MFRMNGLKATLARAKHAECFMLIGQKVINLLVLISIMWNFGGSLQCQCIVKLQLYAF